MTAEPPRAHHAETSPAARTAADELAAFARLFQERRAMERAPGGQRSAANLQAMTHLAPAVQRRLEFIDRSWLQQSRDGGRPLALVHQIAFGDREDYEVIAQRALAQLADAEARYRSGDVAPSDSRARHPRRSFRRRHQYPRMRRLGGGCCSPSSCMRSCCAVAARGARTTRPPPTTALPAHAHAHTERPF